MKMNFTLLLAALSVVLVSVSCQSLGQALSKDSATISGQFSDLKNAFDSGISGMSTQIKDAVSSAQNQLQSFFSGNTTQATAAKDTLANLGTKVGNMSTEVKGVVATAQTLLQTALTGNTSQATAAKDALTNLGTKVGDAVTKIVDNSKNYTSVFWNNDVSTKFRTSAQKLLDFKDIDAKYSAPKAEVANYMVNAKSQPNITDMINLARKHLSAEDASKFFEQMASVAEQQKW
uniref:Apolipophorin-III n=1 Tax=Panagrolaimus sp. ES5 TaxID=591445 RepID=A0AC34FM46_9BILA